MAESITQLGQVWAELARQARLLSQGITVAVGNLNYRLDQEYADLYSGMVDSMLSVHMPLAATVLILDSGVQAIGQRVLLDTGAPYADIYAGVQAVHDALYSRLMSQVSQLG